MGCTEACNENNLDLCEMVAKGFALYYVRGLPWSGCIFLGRALTVAY